MFPIAVEKSNHDACHARVPICRAFSGRFSSYSRARAASAMGFLHSVCGIPPHGAVVEVASPRADCLRSAYWHWVGHFAFTQLSCVSNWPMAVCVPCWRHWSQHLSAVACAAASKVPPSGKIPSKQLLVHVKIDAHPEEPMQVLIC